MSEAPGIRFDLRDCTPVETIDGSRSWTTPDGLLLLINSFPIPPDLPVADDVNDFTRRYREECAAGGVGLVDCAIVTAASTRALQTVIKSPQQPSGMTYVGALTLPWTDCSVVVRVQGIEHGVTGVRDATVLDEAMAHGRVQAGEFGLDGWSDVATTGLDRNLSEDPELDMRFPGHPLTQVRQRLELIAQSLEIEPGATGLAPFPLPQPAG